MLPDCLEANRIMAALWLSFERPSDAQRYVNRLESVDPYLAVELVQGSAPDDDAFRIEELDYQRSSQSEMARARPDWLQEISSEAPASVMVDNGAPADAQSSAGASSNDEEWSNWASAMLNSQAPQPAAENAPAQLPVQSSAQSADARSNPPSTGTADKVVTTGGLTDLFGSPDDAEPAELAALFEGGDSDDESDPMAWLRASHVEIVEDDELPDYDQLFGVDESDSLPEPETNPMAWLEPANVIDEDEDAEDEDPFAWMREADAQPDDEDDLPMFQTAADDELGFAYADESLFAETLTGDPHAEPTDEAEADPWAALDFGDSDDLDDRVDDEADSSPAEAVTAVTLDAPAPERRGLTAILQDANFDWVDRSPEEVVSDDEMDDWLNQFGGSSEPRAAVTDVPDWLTQIEDDQVETADEEEAVIEEEADDGDWLGQIDLGDDEAVGAAEAVAMPDWASSDQGLNGADDDTGGWAAEPASEDGSAWVNDEPIDEYEFAEPLAASGDAEDEAVAVNATVAAEEDSDQAPGLVPEASKPEDVTGKMMSDNEFNWLNKPDSEADDQGELASDIPDWLNELDPTGAAAEEPDDQAEADAEPIPLEDEFGWLDDTDHAEAVVAAEIPDWMSELAPGDSTAEPEPEAETELEWSGESLMPEVDAEAVAGDVPDWLSELEPDEDQPQPEAESAEPAASPESTYEDEFAWLTASEADDADEVAAAEIPDWMSELEPTEADAEPEAAVSETDAEPVLDWSSELSMAEEEEEAAVAEDVPDWLSELEPTEAEAEPEAAVSMIDAEPELEWAGELETIDEEEEATIAMDVPDWLSELEPTEAEAEPEAAVSEIDAEPELEWTGELALDEEEEAAVAEDVPDWLSELEPDEAEAEPEAAVSEIDAEPELEWAGELALDEEEEAAVAEEVPDWLSELEPSAAEAELEAEEAEPSEDDAMAETYGWLNEPSAEAEEEAAAAAEEVPSWLVEDEGELAPAVVDDFEWLNDGVSEAELADEDFEAEIEAEPELEPSTEAVAFDDYGEFDDNQTEIETGADGEELEPEPAHNAPDWLNAMVPGLDVEYDVADDQSDDEADMVEEEPEGEIAWLVDLVDEETAAVEPASFAFSHPPMWLASANPSAASDAADDDFPDWPAEDGDDDMPEWLR